MADALRVNNIHFGNVASNHNQAHIGFTSVGIGSTGNYGALQFVGVPNTLCWTANGTVGIGITSPSYKLHVIGSTYSSNQIGAPYYIGGDQRGVANYYSPASQPVSTFTVGFYGAPGGYGDGIQFNTYVDSSGGDQNLVLFRKSGTIGMRIYRGIFGSTTSYSSFMDAVMSDSNGNVGIGTANPSVTLDVVGNIRATGSITSASINIIPTGIIVMWSGSVSNVPAGWLLCNGTNGTPDLRNRFIVGAGSTYIAGTTGGSNTVTLAIGNLPSHTHTVPDHTHTVPNHTHTTPDHTHSISDPGHTHGRGAYNIGVWAAQSNQLGGYTQETPTLSATTGITVNNGGGGTSGGSGTLTSGGSGTLTSGGAGSGTAITIIPLYYALCYIMKT